MRVFVSFDLEHDRDLHERLSEQAGRQLHFAVSGCSEAGDMTRSWSDRARSRISASDEVVVICGEHTDEAPRVSAELRIAQEERKPYVLVWGRRERMCKKPAAARPDDGIYGWTAEILHQQMRIALRRNEPPAVPEGMKRQVPKP
jgi:hypothetical protein